MTVNHLLSCGDALKPKCNWSFTEPEERSAFGKLIFFLFVYRWIVQVKSSTFFTWHHLFSYFQINYFGHFFSDQKLLKSTWKKLTSLITVFSHGVWWIFVVVVVLILLCLLVIMKLMKATRSDDGCSWFSKCCWSCLMTISHRRKTVIKRLDLHEIISFD